VCEPIFTPNPLFATPCPHVSPAVFLCGFWDTGLRVDLRFTNRSRCSLFCPAVFLILCISRDLLGSWFSTLNRIPPLMNYLVVTVIFSFPERPKNFIVLVFPPPKRLPLPLSQGLLSSSVCYVFFFLGGCVTDSPTPGLLRVHDPFFLSSLLVIFITTSSPLQ